MTSVDWLGHTRREKNVFECFEEHLGARATTALTEIKPLCRPCGLPVTDYTGLSLDCCFGAATA